MKKELYVGVMSGTSMDAIDAVLVSIANNTFKTLAHHSNPIPKGLQNQLSSLCSPGENEIERCGQLDVLFAELIARTVNTLLKNETLLPQDITAIGSHGQTIRHHPDLPKPFSLQIGNPSILAHNTGITTVADFRMADIAANGQGAPLVPAFHHSVFKPEKGFRAIINIGGIANITILNSSSIAPQNTALKNEEEVIGYDIGPGNTLMDQWILRHKNEPFDINGCWARSGQVIPSLLKHLLADIFIKRPPPKSSGREYFNLAWLNNYIEGQPKDEDVQRTLAEFTAQVLANTINHETKNMSCDVFLCGGGVRNTFLRERIDSLLPKNKISTTCSLGIDAQLVEAAAFAWLAKQTLRRLPGNIQNVTGAHCSKILGGIYLA